MPRTVVPPLLALDSAAHIRTSVYLLLLARRDEIYKPKVWADTVLA